jgi:hypothetical protein
MIVGHDATQLSPDPVLDIQLERVGGLGLEHESSPASRTRGSIGLSVCCAAWSRITSRRSSR